LVLSAHAAGVPVMFLGGGSNVLVPDEGVPGLVVLNRCRAFRVDPHPEHPRVWAEAGVSLAGLARTLIRQGLDGLTWAVSIPGTVGGAVVGNAGAHGGDMASVVERVTLLLEDGRITDVPAEDLEYGYRHSRLKAAKVAGRLFPIVLAATLRLRWGDAAALRAQADAHLAYRRRTQPSEPSVGSVFRNPPGDYAGRLIDAAGLKGYRVGDVAVSQVHANFIINLGQGTTTDALKLIRIIKERVREQFGVDLEEEIVVTIT
ncbi:MAG: UDP-N-acetylmuramate dehydrogenase, partial [Chloroflexi bacterium]|nr:UDP-N-acetylmuramate dehydrogenase [Chloroflexota bacterium]